MDFPRLRYEQAGATVQEVQDLIARFNSLPEGAQQSELDRIAGLAEYDLVDELAARRASEGEEAEPGSEPETVLGVVDPPTDQGQDQAEEGAADAADKPPGNGK